MTNIPTIAFAAYSGTGKTTLIEKVIRALKAKNVRLAVIKHDGHKFEIDHEGKDSWRFAHAGADITMISSAEKTAYIEQGDLPLEQLLAMVHGVDLILVEGYKNGNLPQIGIARKETGKGFTAQLSRFIALVTDLDVETDRPVFALDDAEGVANFILEKVAVESSKEQYTAVAAARVTINAQLFAQFKSSGNVKTLAQMAEVLGTAPSRMCCRDGVNLTVCLDEERHSVELEAEVSGGEETEAEMNALSAASEAALAVYDMCRTVQTDAVITDIRLLR